MFLRTARWSEAGDNESVYELGAELDAIDGVDEQAVDFHLRYGDEVVRRRR